ncbi:MAG: hypothetical protein K0S38_604 [Candidatus Paceibacter sp.]|jgi:hypothetical protein|nr:hypothetical protein [Candidatus Paceibacter sp.]
MSDLGIYNFIKKCVEEGKSKDTIVASLIHGGTSKEVIDLTYDDVINNRPPVQHTPTPDPVLARLYLPFSRPNLITVLCGYYFVSWAIAIVGVFYTLLTAMLLNSNPASFVPVSYTLSSLIYIAIMTCYVISVWGYWFMKRWGVFLFFLTSVGQVAYLLYPYNSITQPMLLALILPMFVPFVMIIAGGSYFNRMT